MLTGEALPEAVAEANVVGIRRSASDHFDVTSDGLAAEDQESPTATTVPSTTLVDWINSGRDGHVVFFNSTRTSWR